MGADYEEIRSFKTSLCYDLTKDQLRRFYLHGQDDYFEYLREAGVFTRIIEAQSEVQIINILGYVLKKPMADLDSLPADRRERLLRTGDLCFIKESSRKQLDKVVKQMKSFRFELIPLIAVTDRDDAGKNGETLLIKVHEHGGGCSFVDISARIYDSFGNFLVDNTLPPSILCYPKGGVLKFGADNRVKADCSKVGTTNAILGVMDVVVGVAGAAGAVGAIFVTGGLAAIPLVGAAGASSLYGVGRGVGKLFDASTHGKSVNPFADTEALTNWGMMTLNVLSFANLGLTGLVTRANGFTAMEKIVFHGLAKGSSACASAVTTGRLVTDVVNNWKQLGIYERISLTSAVCICFREVISFANAERLLRKMQIDGIYKFFKDRLDSVVRGVATVGQNFLTCVTTMFANNDGYLAAAMNLMATIAQEAIDVTVSEDFVRIRLFGLEYRMVNILSMAVDNVSNFVYMIQGIVESLRDGFALLRRICEDRLIESVVFKRALELGGNRADFGKVINQLVEVFMLIRQICDDFSIVTDCQITFKGGHRFTLASAYKTFVNGNGISLLRALVDMNPQEINRMNSLRVQWGSKEGELFAFITHTSIGSSEILVKIRFLLAVFESCTRKSLCITDVHPEQQTVEIDKLIRIRSEQFYQSAYPDFLIDPKLLYICEPARETHREFLETLWKNTCLSPETHDRAFEKVTTLERTFQTCSSAAIQNAISYASTMPCPDLSRFTCHVLFALKDTRNLTHADLQSRFLTFTRRAGECSLDGYCPLTVDPSQLTGTIKDFATDGRLRFGTVENGALHMAMYPMLFRAGMGTENVNRCIAMERFDRVEVHSPYDGKWMVFLDYEEMRIVVGVVRGLGAYIDSYE